jgi:hypothetical protein
VPTCGHRVMFVITDAVAPTDRPWYPPVPAYPHPPDARAGMRVGAGILRGRWRYD